MALLASQEIERQMKIAAGLDARGRPIRKQFTFAGFPQAVAFVTRLVPDARRRITTRTSRSTTGGSRCRTARTTKVA